MGNHFIHRFYPHFKLQVKNNPTYLEDVRVWFMGNNQSLPMFPRLFSHRQRDILNLVAPAQTSLCSTAPRVLTMEKPQLPPWHLHSPFPFQISPWKELTKLQGIKAEVWLPDWLHSP